jgi:putative two-component system response regulator
MEGSGPNILVVDDDVGVSRSLQLICKDAAHIKIAKDGDECLNIIEHQDIDLVIMDINLPDMDGLTVMRRIRERNSSLPIIAISGVGTHSMVAEALSLGAVDFISKPFDIRSVRAAIKSGLSKSRRGVVPSGIQLKEYYLEVLKCLLGIMEVKDPYMKTHSIHVARISLYIGREIGLSDEELDVLRDAAELHDIGKIGISDLILHKNGRLTQSEWAQIKRHPIIGAKILEPIRLLHLEEAIVLSHHESYDGSGYPNGIKGEEIPIYARIIRVADAYHAMTSDRPYRKAIPKDEAIKELNVLSGRQFDPEVAKAFLSWFNKRG